MAGSVCESADLFHVHGESDSVSPWSVGAVCGGADEDGLVICVVDCVPGESPCFCDAWTVVSMITSASLMRSNAISRPASELRSRLMTVFCVGAVVDG